MRKQKGFSLIELMVSLSIGLILLLALSTVYVTANKIANRADLLTTMDESSNIIFEQLQSDLNQAGFVDISDYPKENFSDSHGICSSTDKPYCELLSNYNNDFISGLYQRLSSADFYERRANIDIGNGVMMNVQKNRFMTPLGIISCGNMQPVVGCNGSFSGSPSASAAGDFSCDNASETQQSIQISFQARRSSNINNNAVLDNAIAYDCLGNSIKDDDLSTPATLNGFVVNQYYLSGDQNGELAFFCKGNSGSSGAALVSNVVEMNFLYALAGIGSDTGGVITDYVDADALNASNGMTDLGWASVVGVEVCIVLASEEENTVMNDSLSELQGDTRATCERDSAGEFKNDITKEDPQRFYRRYVKAFEMPNLIYMRANSGD